MSKLNLDRDKIDRCRDLAESVVHPIQKYIDLHSTLSIERATLRLMGLSEASGFARAERGGLGGIGGSAAGGPDGPPIMKDQPYPLANLVVDRIDRRNISMGVSPWIAAAKIKHPRFNLLEIAKKTAEGEINLNELPEPSPEDVSKILQPLVNEAVKDLDSARRIREDKKNRYARVWPPLRYIIVATGNIYEDVKQAVTAARNGADIIAVIRSTAQSLLDYVPHGPTTEGYGGTYATQENFKIMRKALDEVSEETGRYIRLCNYSSGLCMSEIAVMGAFEHLDYLLNDSMYGILFRDINMKRTFVDQYFSRLVIARAGIVINTGEDNYLTTADAYHNHHQVLASQFINEQFAKNAGLRDEQIGLGHAFEMDPKIEDSFIYEMAMAQLVRDVFPRHPIKYMPPTRHMTGDIFYSHVLDAMFNVVGAATNQEIQLLGIPTEALHNPHLQDRYWSLQAANYIFNAAGSLYEEIQFNPNGRLVRRARTILDTTLDYLEKIRTIGLMEAIEQGFFANMSRSREGGKGLEGVFQKQRRYVNPFLRKLMPTNR